MAGQSEVDLDVATLVAALPELERIDVMAFDQFGWGRIDVAALVDHLRARK